MSIADLVNDDIARTQSDWYQHGIHRLEETALDAEIDANNQEGTSRGGQAMQSSVTLGELRDIHRTVRSASAALLDPSRSTEATLALEQARDVVQHAKREWAEFERGKWTNIGGPSDRRIQSFTRRAGEALHSISKLLTAIEAAKPQNVVRRVLADLFGDEQANSVRFTQAADGVTELVDLTSLPHTDPGWQTNQPVQFHTSSGDMPMQELVALIETAQEEAGIADPIKTTILLLE